MTRRGRNEGSLYERADGRWAGTVDLGWQNGKRVRRTVYGKNRAQARDRMLDLQRELAGGVAPAPERLTVEAYLGDWLASAKTTIRASTASSYVSIVRVHIVPSIGRVALRKLTVADVERLLLAKSAAGLSPRRVQMIRAVLRRALGRAVKHRLVPRTSRRWPTDPAKSGTKSNLSPRRRLERSSRQHTATASRRHSWSR